MAEANGPPRLPTLLRAILANVPKGESVAEAEHFRDVLVELEWFVPDVLREIHPEWQSESLDGILPLVARKTGEGEVEIFGQCILISDQTTTPIHLRLQISPSSDEISWMECRLGEKGEHGMVRTPYVSSGPTKRLLAMEGKEDAVNWVYKVAYGQRLN